MLYYFFSIKEKENAYLYNGLNISKDSEALQHQNQYPVIFLSLKDMKNIEFQNQINSFQVILRELIGKYNELFKSDYLDDVEKSCLHPIGKNIAELKDGLRFLSLCLYKHYHKKVVLLIDE